MRTRVKVCGLTTVEDALEVAAAGVDAVGLVFYPPSVRALGLEQAQAIRAALPPFVSVVGLFVDASRDTIERTLAAVSLDCLQFHGDETALDCVGYGVPYIKAARVHEGFDLVQFAARHETAQGILVDAFVPGLPGGTGQTFDWAVLPRRLPCPLVLSGGLTAHNVGEAVRTVHPWAVDVSSGVERTPGRKDRLRVQHFLEAVAKADGFDREK
ncbi:phosphoribosylanthranilate isomerase [Ferrovum sp.]|jgi:phosphoribosylanthranilate isomerase|uniref:phosphoribosylanthranilate isomerase n=1 Tax=Ferrovum sp. TaxID=2609467 RepID=UPI002632224C|nr:phosphoribosylanthranilate isomerase [Ferrovum sp.]